MREQRSYSSRGMDTSVELRDVGGVKTLSGYAIVWNRYSQNLGGFVEVIEPYAATEALSAGNNIAALGNHDPNWLLGTTDSRTLVLTQDDFGLRYDIVLDPTDPDAQRMMAKVATGKLPGSSFSFSLGSGGDSWGQTDRGFPLRSIKSIRSMFDVGPVTFPAYLDTQTPDASTALRSLADAIGRPVDELVAAAGRNELRSFLPGAADESRDAGDPTVHPLSPRQNAIDAAMECVVETFGQFDQTSGPDGAHYMDPSPFPDLKCANCSFYSGMRSCELVAGDISPDAICKLWIVPADLVGAPDPTGQPAPDTTDSVDLGMGAGLPTRSDPRQNPEVIARLRLLAQTRQS